MLQVFVGAFMLQFSVLPFVYPALNYKTLSRLQTTVDHDGVCLQTTDYTCGPASAVTALRQLGMPAEEGELAIWAKTTAATGTPPDVLAQVLREHYGARGLTARLRSFGSVAEMKQGGLILAVIKFDFLQDHFVTVLEVTDESVIVADPLSGRSRYSHASFADVWRFSGIIVGRQER